VASHSLVPLLESLNIVEVRVEYLKTIHSGGVVEDSSETVCVFV
jgi:hypothetical protein